MLTILEVLQARGEVGGQELAQLLEVDERSIRRYVMLLRDMGIPIEAERGRGGGYILRPGFRLPPLMFTAEEITAIMPGLLLMRELGGLSPLAIESAIAKIERVLPEPLRQRAAAIRHSLVLDTTRMYPIPDAHLITLSVAAYEQKTVQITYRGAEGDTTQRRIAPYSLVFHGRACYIPAWCYLRDGLRVFRLDRVQGATLTDEAFTRPAGFDAQRTVFESLAHIPGMYRFEVMFDAPLLTVEEALPPALAILEAIGNQTRMHCYSDDPHWMARRLAATDLPFRVLATVELRDALRALADTLRQSAG
jgi:predicted DNA-binding transcriptional regulator YafY